MYAELQAETSHSPLLHSSLFFDNMLRFIESLLRDHDRFVLSHLVCHSFKVCVWRTRQLRTSCYNGFVILDAIRDVSCNNGVVFVWIKICVVPSSSEFWLGVGERRHRENTKERSKGAGMREWASTSQVLPWDQAIAWQNCWTCGTELIGWLKVCITALTSGSFSRLKQSKGWGRCINLLLLKPS